MPLEIFPQNLTLFPSDRQLFTARAKGLTPYWHNIGGVSKGVVKPDFSLAMSFPFDDDVTAEGALQLTSGVGSIEWVINPKCMMNTAILFGDLRFNHRFEGPTADGWQFNLSIDGDDILVISEPGGPVSVSLPHNLAVGDRIKVQLANGFRLFVNGVLRHERVTGFTGNIGYPATYSARITEDAIDPNPAIPAPLLEGDWQLKPVMAFSVNHGSLSSPGPGLQTEYFNGTVPGAYALVGQIDPGLDVWVEDNVPTGGVVASSGGTWNFNTIGGGAPGPFSGDARLKSPLAAGLHHYQFTGATRTLQINKDDVLVCYVFLDATNPPQQVQLAWNATDASGFEHRAYWGANLIGFGINGTPSRRFMGPLPATGAWVRLEIPASLVDLEGRVLNGMSFELFDGVCSFDLVSKYPGKLQTAEALITIPPLAILGDLVRTIQPGAKARFQTNYDIAQNALITWSVVSGGGSFSEGEFTAPTPPGETTIRATSGDQIADLTVNVPAIITPGFTFAAPLEEINWDTNISSMPAFVGAGTQAAGTGNISPGLPPDLRDDDIMLLVVETANEAVSTPAGWAIVADSPQGTGTGGGVTSTRVSLFWKRVAGAEVGPTITDPGDHAIAQIFSIRGCINTGNPWDVTAGDVAAGAVTGVSIPGDTTSLPLCLVFQVVANQTDSLTSQASGYANADLANLTERANINTDQGNGGGFTVLTGEKAVAGPFGATTATLAIASVQGRITVVLRPTVTVWTSNPAGINASTGEWIAPNNLGLTAKITATDGAFSATRDVLIIEKFPFSDFTLPLTWDRNLTALISMSEDRTSRITREKAPPFDSYPVRLTSRTLADSNAIDAFFDVQGFGKPFILEDKVRGIRKVGWFDSPIRHEARDECDIDLAFQFLEARI